MFEGRCYAMRCGEGGCIYHPPRTHHRPDSSPSPLPVLRPPRSLVYIRYYLRTSHTSLCVSPSDFQTILLEPDVALGLPVVLLPVATRPGSTYTLLMFLMLMCFSMTPLPFPHGPFWPPLLDDVNIQTVQYSSSFAGSCIGASLWLFLRYRPFYVVSQV